MARIEARIDGTIKSKAKDVLANHGLRSCLVSFKK